MQGKLTLEFLGYHWEWSGDVSYLTRPDVEVGPGHEEARVGVDSVGHVFYEIRRIPEDGRSYFHTERVESGRVYGGIETAEEDLRARGFTKRRIAPYAHRVRERGI